MLVLKKKAEHLMNIMESSRIITEREINYEVNHVSFLEKTLNSLKSAVDKLRIVRNMSVIGGTLAAKSRFRAEHSASPKLSRFSKIQEKMKMLRKRKKKRFRSPLNIRTRQKANNVGHKSSNNLPFDNRDSTEFKSAYNFRPALKRNYRRNSKNNRFSDIKSIKSLDMFKQGNDKSFTKVDDVKSIRTYNLRNVLERPNAYRTVEANIRKRMMDYSPDITNRMEDKSYHDFTIPSSVIRSKKYKNIDFKKKRDIDYSPLKMNTFQEDSKENEEIMKDEEENVFGVEKKVDDLDIEEGDTGHFKLKAPNGSESPKFVFPVDDEERIQFESQGVETPERVDDGDRERAKLEERFQQRQIQLDQISAELEKFDTDDDSDDFDRERFVNL